MDSKLLCAAGIHIKIENFPGLMHNKFMVIDPASPSPRVITGSMNWTTSGTASNDENTLIIHDPTTASSYASAFHDLDNDLDPEILCKDDRLL